MKIYMVEVGVMLDEKHRDFEYYKREVYDEYYGLFDENTCAFLDEKEALDFLKEYVAQGVQNTYGIMWEVEREINDYEMEELIKQHYLEDEFLPRNVKTEHFYVKEA